MSLCGTVYFVVQCSFNFYVDKPRYVTIHKKAQHHFHVVLVMFILL